MSVFFNCQATDQF